MKAPALTLTVGDSTWSIDDDREALTIGRAASSDIRLTGASVSRTHARLSATPLGWELSDVGSQHGTFIGSERVTKAELLRLPATIRLGPERGGSTLRVSAPSLVAANPANPADSGDSGEVTHVPVADPSSAEEPRAGVVAAGQPATAPPHTSAKGPGFADTVVLAGPIGGPETGPPRSGPDLLVVSDGHELRFRHPSIVTIGRQPGSTITLTDPVASRQHARIDPFTGGWTYTNLSAEGSFVDGERLTVRELQGRTTIRLGHPVAGPELEVVPILSAREEEARFARRKRGRRLRTAAAAGLAVVVVAALVTTALLVLPGSQDASTSQQPSAQSPESLTADKLAEAKVATVLILGKTTDSSGAPVQYNGSGSIISPDGLILTNAHVAEPETQGLEERYGTNNLNNPSELLIALVEDPDDSPVAPSYRAEVVASDGRIDASVIKIISTVDGDDVDDLDLPTLPLGDSDALRTGEDVTILGFPGIAQSTGVSVTKGVIASFVNDPEVAGDRSEIDTDARIAPGNSGGAAINNAGEIIGVPSAFFAQEGVPVVSGRIRPINVIVDLFDAVNR